MGKKKAEDGKKSVEEGKKKDLMSMSLRVGGAFGKFRGILDGCVDSYCRLTKIESADAMDMVERKALSFMEKGRYEKAIGQYNTLIRMGEEDASVYCNLGVCCEQEGLDEEAESAFKKALKLDKNLHDASHQLGLLALKNDDPKTAVKHLKSLAAKNGKSFDIFYSLGIAYDKLKDYENAAQSFEKAAAVEPGYAKIYKRLGYTYDTLGRHEEAVEHFKKAMELEEV